MLITFLKYHLKIAHKRAYNSAIIIYSVFKYDILTVIKKGLISKGQIA